MSWLLNEVYTLILARNFHLNTLEAGRVQMQIPLSQSSEICRTSGIWEKLELKFYYQVKTNRVGRMIKFIKII